MVWIWLRLHLASVVGFVLATAFALVIVRQRRPPASALAWLLVVFFVPWLGVPLYLAFGGRKLTARSRRKPGLDFAADVGGADADDPLARILYAAGAGAPSHGNAVAWQPGGEDAYAALIAAIDGARASIRITTFVFDHDEVGRAIAARLAARARAGVAVHVLVDGLLARQARPVLAELRAAGARTAVFLPLIKLPLRGRSNLRNHRKLVVVDGELAILGGRNLAGEYLGPTPRPGRWRDLSFTLRGPAVARVDVVFRADWHFATGEALAVAARAPAAEAGAEVAAAAAAAGPAAPAPAEPGEAVVHIVPSGPDVTGDTIYEALLHAVFTVEKRLWIATPYFAPDQALERGLELAARAGVDVRLLVPARSNHGIADLVTRSFLAGLAKRGVTVLRYLPGMVHTKLVLADGLVIAGSANFDMRSLFLDFEMCLVTRDPASAALLEAHYRELAAACDPTPAPRRLRDDLGRLLAPLV